MPARKTLYLLRRPIVDSVNSLLPSASKSLPGACSLVLLENAVSSPPPPFPGPLYLLPAPSDAPVKPAVGIIISYPDLVALIDEHDATIVL